MLQGLAAGGLEWTAEHAGLAPIRSIVQWILRQCIKVIVRGVEIFPPPGHTGVWCSGNTPSSALCNEESCGSIPSTSDSFYENSNKRNVRVHIDGASSVI